MEVKFKKIKIINITNFVKTKIIIMKKYEYKNDRIK